jgi:hypothetical protein
MKWREPWRQTLRSQPRFLPKPGDFLKSGAIWTGFLLALVLVAAFSNGLAPGFMSRAWQMVVFGFGLAFALHVIQWPCPATVDSGPRGIVRSKGGAITLNNAFHARRSSPCGLGPRRERGR